MLGAGALGRLRGMVWGGKREEGSSRMEREVGWGFWTGEDTCITMANLS